MEIPRFTLLLGFLLAVLPTGSPASDQPKPSPNEIAELQALAEAGDAKAQFNLGLLYENGRGVLKNESQAAKWFHKAAQQGDVKAQFNFGIMCANGMGIPKDEAEALKWFRMAAEQGYAIAQNYLGASYTNGWGVAKNNDVAAKWYQKAAEQGHLTAQYNLGVSYANGWGVPKDDDAAAKWYQKSADQGYAEAQYNLAWMYRTGQLVPKDESEAARLFQKAAMQGLAVAQFGLGLAYAQGQGVPKDDVLAYKWWLLAAAQGLDGVKKNILMIERHLTPTQRAEGQQMARDFQPKRNPLPGDSQTEDEGISESRPEHSGSGFFITDDGYLITNQHVADETSMVRVVTAAGPTPAKVLKVDKANDLALLKVEGKFASVPVTLSRNVRLGATVATVGFPNVGLQGFSPKLAKGEIASLSGAQDDARYFQTSVPVQPGNSGGALVDAHGNVIGVIVAKLSQKAALAASGSLPENVNYAVKSSYLLSFLESAPEVSAKLKEPITTDRKFEDVVKDVEQASVLVLVY